MQAMTEPVVVVVVGSGVSGLAAARTLIDNWHGDGLSVVVLEAGKHIGGRTFTDRSVDWPSISGAEVDMGASWMHGSCPDHPITRIKDALGLGTFVTDDEKMSTFRDGDEVDDDKFDDYEDLADAAAKVAKKSPHDLSMWDSMAGLGMGGGRDNPYMQFHMANTMAFDVGASPSTISGKMFENDEAFDGKETILLGGYSQIPEALAMGKVRLEPGADNKSPAVTAGNGAAVDIKLGVRVNGIALGGDHLALSTECGQNIKADYCVLCVPLGVLKSDTIKFSPALPDPMHTAISRIGFGDVVKIGLLFDKVFWDRGTHYFGLVHEAPGKEKAEKFSYFLNAEGAVHKPILMTFAFGQSAMEVEAMSDEALWSSIRENLVLMFGKDALNGVHKVGMWRSRWGHEPNFCGAYSYPAVNSRPEDWAALIRPCMDDRLFLAGEHTCFKYRGTVHGAFFSGQRAAREILRKGGNAQHVAHGATSDGGARKKDKRKESRKQRKRAESSS